jgi:excisionase family DNA binding protein
MNTPKTDTAEHLHDYPWLCNRLGISPITARKWVHQKRVPYIKLAGGSLVRFRESDIEAWIEAQLRQAEH